MRKGFLYTCGFVGYYAKMYDRFKEILKDNNIKYRIKSIIGKDMHGKLYGNCDFYTSKKDSRKTLKLWSLFKCR